MSKEALAILLPLMDWLESEKGKHADNDAVANEVDIKHIDSFVICDIAFTKGLT